VESISQLFHEYDCGDVVVVINADSVKFSGSKNTKKFVSVAYRISWRIKAN